MKKNVKIIKSTGAKVMSDVNEDTIQIRNFIIILVCVALVSVLLYFLSSRYLIKDGVENDNSEEVAVEIAYDTVNVGNVFNRPYDEYYVFAYDPDSLKASYYASLLNNFDIEDSKIYFLDLSKEVNKKYLGENSNKKATKPSELFLKEPTLIKITDGKISLYYDNIEDIESEIK